jgi:hypothetical protein
MMKKLLAVILVLGMASFANAGLIFTVNGQPQPPSITLSPSEEVMIDLHLGAGQTSMGLTLDYVLSNGQATIITDYAQFPDPSPWMLGEGFIVFTPQHVQFSAATMISPVAGPQDLFWDVFIHCLDETPVVLEIIAQAGTELDGEYIPAGTVLHTLLIEQIPEPATIALLGLGGLFLLRRRK